MCQLLGECVQPRSFTPPRLNQTLPERRKYPRPAVRARSESSNKCRHVGVCFQGLRAQLAVGCCHGDKLPKMHQCCLLTYLWTRLGHFETRSFYRYVETLPHSFFCLGNLPLSSPNSQHWCVKSLETRHNCEI